MRSIVLTFAILSALGFASAAPAWAQPSFQVTIGRWFESTTASVSDPDETRTTSARLSAEHQLAGERLRLFYHLDAGDFSTLGAWSYVLHNAGAMYRVDFAQGRHKLFVGGNATMRSNGASWSEANYGAVEGLANAQFALRGSSTLRVGYRLDVRRFADLPELNQVEQVGFASLLANLPSRTTLIGEVQVGRKNYEGDPIYLEASSHQPVSGGMRGRGQGPMLGLTPAVPSVVQGGDRAGQVTWLGRVAQSLADRLGVAAQYTQRRTFGTMPPGVVETPPMFFEDGVYDDPYASDLDALSTSLKYVFARGDVVEGWGAWMYKDYRATLALGPDGSPLPGEPLRSDRLARAGAGWTVPIRPGRTGPADIDLIVGYVYTRARSNDAFYTYASHMLGLSVAVGF